MLRRHARKIDAFQGRWGIGVSWLMLGMVLVVFGDVIFRYLFNKSWVFIQELEWHLFGLVYLLAAGYTMLHNEHVRVDIWYAKQSPRKKAWVDFILLFVMFFPSCVLIIYTTWPFLKHSLQVNEGSTWATTPTATCPSSRWTAPSGTRASASSSRASRRPCAAPRARR